MPPGLPHPAIFGGPDPIVYLLSKLGLLEDYGGLAFAQARPFLPRAFRARESGCPLYLRGYALEDANAGPRHANNGLDARPHARGDVHIGTISYMTRLLYRNIIVNGDFFDNALSSQTSLGFSLCVFGHALEIVGSSQEKQSCSRIERVLGSGAKAIGMGTIAIGNVGVVGHVSI